MTFINPTEAREATRLLRAHPLFAPVGEADLAELVNGGRMRRLDTDQMLFGEQEEANFWWLVLEGSVHMMRICCDGEERIFGTHPAGEVIGEVVMFNPDRHYPVACRATESCRLYQFGRQPLHTLCLSHPALAINLLGRASQRLSRRVNQLEWMSGTTASQRLADYLLSLKQAQGCHLELPYNQRQLAATLGIRAETLSRLLGDWLRAGYIRGSRRQWEIRDASGLNRISRSMGRIVLGA